MRVQNENEILRLVRKLDQRFPPTLDDDKKNEYVIPELGKTFSKLLAQMKAVSKNIF